MNDADVRSLKILHTFLQALAHRVRTPLSVVSNDLHYFRTIVDPDLCDKDIERCKEISSIFSECSFSFDENAAPADFNVRSVVVSAFRISEDPGVKPIIMRGDSALFERAMSLMKKVLDESYTAQGVSVSVSKDGGSTKTFARMIIEFVPVGKGNGLTESEAFFSSAIDFSLSRGAASSTFASIADAILWAHGAKVLFRSGAKLFVELTVPLSQ